LNADSTVVAPPTSSEVAFPQARRLRSRDIFHLLGRVWPFIRPYRRHLTYLFLLTLPAMIGALIGLILTRIFFDVVGNGGTLKPAEAWLLRVPLHADRSTVLIHACVVAGIGAILALLVFGSLFLYGIWILQRFSNLFRVNLYTRMQELSVRFHSEEKIGDAIFRMFQDSAAIPSVINGLIIHPLLFFPAAVGILAILVWIDFRMALIAALLLPANLIVAWWYSNSLRTAFIGEREKTADATTRIEETLASIKTVKAFGTESTESDN
jgi:ABC-type multidrug transport system fused ATPase/permease subunit